MVLHQDARRKWAFLILDERINVTLDILAKHALVAGVMEQKFISSRFPFKKVRVLLKGDKVTGLLQKAIDNYWGGGAAHNWLAF